MRLHGFTLTPMMVAHLKHGLGGAKAATKDAFERRGLLEDVPQRPGLVRFNETGRALGVALRNPPRAGISTTLPESQECEHGHSGMWVAWRWDPSRGASEETSEPVILEVPPGCHACGCDDPFCSACHQE